MRHFPSPEWCAVEDRFKKERSYYDFETLSFRKDGSKKGARKLLIGIATESSDGRFTVHTSEDFSDKLDLYPSQRVLQEAQRVNSGSSKNQRSRSITMKKDFELDKLATDNVGVVGRETEIQELEVLYLDAKTKMAVVVIGPSGSGKSVLAMEMKSIITSRGGLFCAGNLINRTEPIHTKPLRRQLRHLSIRLKRIKTCSQN